METVDRHRRLILRGALGAGCVLALPSLVVGCGGREEGGDTTTSEAAPEPAAGKPEGSSGGMTSSDGGGNAASGKAAKDQVAYQEQPKGEEKCSNCRFFVAGNNTCEVVKGKVSPEAWCNLWVKTA